MSLQRYPQFDFSGAIQVATSFLMKKQNELANVRNARFGTILGSIVRRFGSSRAGSIFGAGSENTPTGGSVIKFTTGNKRFVAVNNSGGTATIIRVQDSGTGAWSTLSGITGLPVDAKIYFFLYRDEVFITGYDPATGDPITPWNVDASLNVSSTRNILHMPACYYLAEYNGALYAANVEVDSTRYKDRAYKSSGPLGFITTVQADQSGLLTEIAVDSVRYLKPSMAIDIYARGTDTKKYDLTIASVNKSLNTITVTPSNQTFEMGGVNVGTDEITLTSAAHLTTGTPIVFSSTSGAPAPLVAGTTYYAINVSSTVIKVATTAGNAAANVAVDLTHQGAFLTFATSAVNTGTDVITLSSTTGLTTGMPIRFTSTTTLPAGLSAGTTYYAIVLTDTTIQVATSFANAEAGTDLDITSVGTGTHTIISGSHTVGVSYDLDDNDEVWLDGRKGELTTFWNTDYPTPETADWTATRPGTDSSNEITAIAKSSNRLFLFTKRSSQKFDGANTVTFNNAVGCISQDSLKNIDDDWLIWLDAKGRVWARNESTGQQEYISRGINRNIMKFTSLANRQEANATVTDNLYYLYLGQVDVGKGNEYLRVVYSFDDNIWTVDRLPRPALFHTNDDYSGEELPYYYSTDGYLYKDNDSSSNLDHNKIIPFEIDLGRDTLGGEQTKRAVGLFLFTENCEGMMVKVSTGGGQPRTVGKVKSNEQYLQYRRDSEDGVLSASTYNVFLSDATDGDPQVVHGVVQYFNVEEMIPNEKRPERS